MKIGNVRVLGANYADTWQRVYRKVIATPTYSARQNTGGTPTSSGAIGGSTDAQMWNIAGGQGYISGTVTTGWAQYQFSSALIIRAIDMNCTDYGATYTIPASFTIQGSNNGSSWTTLMTVATAGLTSGVTKRFEFYNDTAYSYLRVNITGWTSSDTYGGVGLDAYTMTNQADGPVTSLTISGLDGNTAEEYLLRVKVAGLCHTPTHITILPNNDTGANYGAQTLQGNSTTVGAEGTTAATSWVLSYNSLDNGSVAQYESTIYAKSGYVRTMLSQGVDRTATTVPTYAQTQGHAWNNTADNISSLVIKTSVTGTALGPGTIELYAKRTKI